MFRPIFYLLSLLANTVFWSVLLLFNYLDYTGIDPYQLQDDYATAFMSNRFMLLLAELLFPLAMVLGFMVLVFMKLRPRPVRWPYLLLLFMCVEFWVWRTFFFQDRLASYYFMSETKGMELPYSEVHGWILGVYVVIGIVILGVKEYTFGPDTPLERAMAQLRRARRRGEA
ncbi:MAG: hypothetical protein AAF570_21505 [Bacteroidota bacterium]